MSAPTVTLYGVDYTLSYLADSSVTGLLPPTELDALSDPVHRISIPTDVGGAFLTINGVKYALSTICNSGNVMCKINIGNRVLKDIVVDAGSKSVDAKYLNNPDNDIEINHSYFSLFTVRDPTPIP